MNISKVCDSVAHDHWIVNAKLGVGNNAYECMLN